MDKKMQQAEQLLQQKYQEPFKAVYFIRHTGMQMHDSYTVVCHPVRKPELKFKAEIESGGGYLLDEYVSRNVCHRLEQQLNARLPEAPAACIVRVGTGTRYVTSAQADISIPEFIMQNPQARFIIYMIWSYEKNRPPETLYPKVKNMLRGVPAINGGVELYLADAQIMRQVRGQVREASGMNGRLEKTLRRARKIWLPVRKGELAV